MIREMREKQLPGIYRSIRIFMEREIAISAVQRAAGGCIYIRFFREDIASERAFAYDL